MDLTSSTVSTGYPSATMKLRNHLSPLSTLPFGAMILLELPSPFVFQPTGRSWPPSNQLKSGLGTRLN